MSEDIEKSKKLFLLNWVMFASISSGLHVALLTKEQRLSVTNDRFFNGIRIICQLIIMVGMCFVFESLRSKVVPIGVFAVAFVIMSIVLAVAKKNKKTTIGVLSFFLVLGYTIIAILLFTMWKNDVMESMTE